MKTVKIITSAAVALTFIAALLLYPPYSFFFYIPPYRRMILIFITAAVSAASCAAALALPKLRAEIKKDGVFVVFTYALICLLLFAFERSSVQRINNAVSSWIISFALPCAGIILCPGGNITVIKNTVIRRIVISVTAALAAAQCAAVIALRIMTDAGFAMLPVIYIFPLLAALSSFFFTEPKNNFPLLFLCWACRAGLLYRLRLPAEAAVWLVVLFTAASAVSSLYALFGYIRQRNNKKENLSCQKSTESSI